MAEEPLMTQVATALDPTGEDTVPWKPRGAAIVALGAVPNGWLKIDGHWIEVEPITHDADDEPGKESHGRFCVDQETFYARKERP